MKKKTRVGILFGGKSAEHEVALQSAKNIVEAIDEDAYEVVLIGIDKQGQWHLQDSARFLLNVGDPKTIALDVASDDERLAVVPGIHGSQVMKRSRKQEMAPVDVIFPVLHGPYGEDGTVQGLLKLLDIPFVGASVLGSAIGMDKDVMKRLFREAGIPMAKFLVIPRYAKDSVDFQHVAHKLGLPCFVKPANLGSSVGVGKASNETEFRQAVEEAFRYDVKILVEEYVQGREIECSVLGNESPIASLPGEVITDTGKHQFYSYQAKYLDENGATLAIPANLPDHLIKQVQDLSIKAFQVLCCEGMARVDCFLANTDQVLINEINTIPGFTRISMYPKLWEASGIAYPELIDRLIQLAIERNAREQTLATSFSM
jgi:D-alanine-D-alanine ligase